MPRYMEVAHGAKCNKRAHYDWENRRSTGGFARETILQSDTHTIRKLMVLKIICIWMCGKLFPRRRTKIPLQTGCQAS